MREIDSSRSENIAKQDDKAVVKEDEPKKEENPISPPKSRSPSKSAKKEEAKVSKQRPSKSISFSAKIPSSSSSSSSRPSSSVPKPKSSTTAVNKKRSVSTELGKVNPNPIPINPSSNPTGNNHTASTRKVLVRSQSVITKPSKTATPTVSNALSNPTTTGRKRSISNEIGKGEEAKDSAKGNSTSSKKTLVRSQSVLSSSKNAVKSSSSQVPATRSKISSSASTVPTLNRKSSVALDHSKDSNRKELHPASSSTTSTRTLKRSASELPSRSTATATATSPPSRELRKSPSKTLVSSGSASKRTLTKQTSGKSVSAVINNNNNNEISSKKEEEPSSLVKSKAKAGPQGRKAPSNMKTLRENVAKIEQKDQKDVGRSKEAASYIGENIGGMGIIAAVGGSANIKAKEAVFVAADQVKLKASEGPQNSLRLMRVKGKRRISLRLMDSVHSSLNEGDSFILDDNQGSNLYVWLGSKSSKMEKSKALDAARRINAKEKGTRSKIITLDQKEGTDNEERFWNLLGADGKTEIADEKSGGSDEAADSCGVSDVLYKVTPLKLGREGKLEKINSTKFGQELLNPKEIFVLDCKGEVFMWAGKSSPNPLRSAALKLAKELFAEADRPSWARFSKEADGAESILFKEKFWNFKDDIPIVSKAEVKSKIAKKREETFSVSNMFEHKKVEELFIDDGADRLKMWYVNSDAKQVEYPEEMRGHFFNEDSFILLYVFKGAEALYEGSKDTAKFKDRYMIYFWQGLRSGHKKKGWSALLTTDMSNQLKGETPTQHRVPQQKENSHFMSLFKGVIIIHQGHFASYEEKGTQLYHLRGQPDVNLRIIQVDSKAKNLNSNDSFFLFYENSCFVWNGKYSALSGNVDSWVHHANRVRKGEWQMVQVKEGEEPNEFWEALGGRSNYMSDKIEQSNLFHCNFATGIFSVDYVNQFAQDDLEQRDLFILDTVDRIFVWKGAKCDKKETKVLETAVEYAASDPTGKRKESPIYYVNSHEEPYEFTSMFHGWDDSKAKKVPGIEELTLVPALLAETKRTYTLAELQQKPSNLDNESLEMYLSDQDFEKLFKMNKDEWKKAPAWKTLSLRKTHKLF
eukprot:TRINITY_DN1988_c1_g1_i3.p1 TRINITY_DN1988_c1_g1~~TRINITY_DN1988_c1_g1_i3.p1  ORF type:complete len:1152 (+),score=420.18 TRINITY_DN1988_c1_g1_i3:181-3456(+)